MGNTVIEFAKKLPTAGSFYTFWSRTLGNGFAVYAYLRAKSPEKLAALGATMATDEIDFAEARSTSLSTGGSPELPGPEVP